MRTLVRSLFVALAAVSVTLAAASAHDVSTPDQFLDDWVIECVDCVRSFPILSPHSAAMAPDGVIHAVYGSDGLYHVAYGGGEWTIETINSVENHSLPVMTVDELNRVHILYIGAGGLPIYLRQTAAGWESLSITNLPNSAGPPSVLVVRDGVAHFAFAHNGNELMYARLTGDDWLIESIDQVGIAYGEFAIGLALDVADRPAVCYLAGSSARVARRISGNWVIETIPSANTDGMGCDLAFDAGDALHVAHRAVDGLRYSLRGPSGWTTEMVVPGSYAMEAGRAPSLRIAADGAPHIAFATLHRPETIYPVHQYWSQHFASRTETGWQVETIGEDNDRDGTLIWTDKGPIVVYRGALGLSLAERNDGDWTSILLDRAGDLGYRTSITFYGLEMRISYFDWENTAVHYASGSAGQWSLETIDHRPIGFEQTDLTRLALDPHGTPHIVYNFYDRFTGVDYAFKVGKEWQLNQLAGDATEPYALGVDRDGQAHFSQLDWTTGNLVYTQWSPDTSPVYEVVDKQAAKFTRMDMVVDAEGYVHLAFVRGGTAGGVGYATRTPGGWVVETIPGSSPLAQEAALALDGEGRPHLAYVALGLVTYAVQDVTGEWTTAPVTGELYCEEVDIAVDQHGRVHVTYFGDDGSLSRLRYARREGNAMWQVITLAEWDEGWDSSLALDPFGNPAIAYRAGEPGDLMVTYVAPGGLAEAYLPAVAP